MTLGLLAKVLLALGKAMVASLVMVDTLILKVSTTQAPLHLVGRKTAWVPEYILAISLPPLAHLYPLWLANSLRCLTLDRGSPR